MKKAILRREFIKLRIAGKTNKECQKLLGINFDRRTLRRWWNRFNEEDKWNLEDADKTKWNLEDADKTPIKIQIKFSDREKEVIEKRSQTKSLNTFITNKRLRI